MAVSRKAFLRILGGGIVVAAGAAIAVPRLDAMPAVAVEGWRGPYLQRGIPKDPWQREYVYKFPGQQNPSGFDLYSFGPDGREGADDIGNWNKQ